MVVRGSVAPTTNVFIAACPPTWVARLQAPWLSVVLVIYENSFGLRHQTPTQWVQQMATLFCICYCTSMLSYVILIVILTHFWLLLSNIWMLVSKTSAASKILPCDILDFWVRSAKCRPGKRSFLLHCCHVCCQKSFGSWVTDFSGLSSYGLTAPGMKVSSLPILL